MTWSFNGRPPQTTTGFVSSYPPSGTDCWFDFGYGQIFPAVGDAGADRLFQGSLTVRCGGGGDGGFDFFFSELGDYRDWSAGTFTMTGRFAMDSPGDASCRFGDQQNIPLAVTVETAIGGGAPYPQLVTPDFVRTFRLDLDTSTVSPTKNDGTPCDSPFVGQVSLHLTQTAADYVYDADAPCYCE